MLREQIEDVSTIGETANPQALPSELQSITAPPKGRGVDRDSGLPPAGKEPAPESPADSSALTVAKSHTRRTLVSALLVALLALGGAAYWYGDHGMAGAPTTGSSSLPPPGVTVSKP